MNELDFAGPGRNAREGELPRAPLEHQPLVCINELGPCRLRPERHESGHRPEHRYRDFYPDWPGHPAGQHIATTATTSRTTPSMSSPSRPSLATPTGRGHRARCHMDRPCTAAPAAPTNGTRRGSITLRLPRPRPHPHCAAVMRRWRGSHHRNDHGEDFTVSLTDVVLFSAGRLRPHLRYEAP